MRAFYKYLLDYLRGFEAIDFIAKPLAATIVFIAILFLAWFAFYLTNKIILVLVRRIAEKTKTEWDDILVKHKVFKALAHLVPAFILYYTCDFSAPSIHQELSELSADALALLSVDHYFTLSNVLLKIVQIYFAIIIISVVNKLLNAANEIYNTTSYAHHRPIKGYVQLVKIFVYFMAGILIISVLLGKDPTVLLAGLGALAAVLILVFKDTILGFVASIQLSANDMVKIGDWISMPGHRADGTVIDITLNTVKVQNWDKTIATIPTYSLVSESFNNWEGMEKSDGRRIKRSVTIDMSSIQFCGNELLAKFKNLELIKEYVIEKQKEVESYNIEKGLPTDDRISRRSQTNVGIFRKYLELYLENHPMINKQMTFLVRQLQPTDKGLPIEIYVFSKDKAWANYEAIQADIFDHILAVIPEFELRVFQAPTGYDIHQIVK